MLLLKYALNRLLDHGCTHYATFIIRPYDIALANVNLYKQLNYKLVNVKDPAEVFPGTFKNNMKTPVVYMDFITPIKEHVILTKDKNWRPKL